MSNSDSTPNADPHTSDPSRIRRTITFVGGRQEVWQLLEPQRFIFKAANLEKLREAVSDKSERAYIIETRQLSEHEYDVLASDLLIGWDWLVNKGGYYVDGRMCVEVKAPGRPTLLIDPSGYEYPRYVAILR